MKVDVCDVVAVVVGVDVTVVVGEVDCDDV